MNNVDPERWKTARHEAGHAVAALHYDCPIEHVSIEAQWPALGTTHLGISKRGRTLAILVDTSASMQTRDGAERGTRLAEAKEAARRVVRTLGAEDQAMVRGALAALLRLEGDIAIVAEVARGDEILSTALATQPDVALVDIEMPGQNGLDAAHALREHLPSCRVVICWSPPTLIA